jgi:serine/threonine protein kinase
MAPEAIDFWAFGVLLYQVLENRSPFYGNNERETFQATLKGKFDFLPSTDKHARSLITKLLTAKVADRIGSWSTVKNHSFFTGVNWQALKQIKVTAPFSPELTGPEDTGNFDEILRLICPLLCGTNISSFESF